MAQDILTAVIAGKFYTRNHYQNKPNQTIAASVKFIPFTLAAPVIKK